MHDFKSDLIHNMDHMIIPGTETSSVIFNQIRRQKNLKCDTAKAPK